MTANERLLIQAGQELRECIMHGDAWREHDRETAIETWDALVARIGPPE